MAYSKPRRYTMKTQEITTTNLADFCYRERCILANILDKWNSYGLPKGFNDDEVVPMLNKESGYVFLTNADYQCAMMNGSKLEIWHVCPNCGYEGFEEDCQLNDDGCNQCKEGK